MDTHGNILAFATWLFTALVTTTDTASSRVLLMFSHKPQPTSDSNPKALQRSAPLQMLGGRRVTF